MTYSSGQLIDELDEVIRDDEGENPEGVVIWLDYTRASEIGEQIREFEALLDKLAVGDVVRVTVNAHPPSLASGSEGSIPAHELRERRFETLSRRVGDYLPSDATPAQMDRVGLARVLSLAFGRAAVNALPVGAEETFSLLSLVRYADGQQMLSLTGAIVARNEERDMRNAMAMEGWPFVVPDWESVRPLRVPDLTIRERMFLEQAMDHQEPHKVAAQLGFALDEGASVEEFLDDYRKYYRFYPSVLSTEL